jgi:hypothetical protein
MQTIGIYVISWAARIQVELGRRPTTQRAEEPDYLEGTLDSFLVQWEEKARISWLSQAEQVSNFFKFVRESLLKMDTKTRGEALSMRIQNGIMTPNEAREKEDLSAYPDGDQFYMAGNILPISGPKVNQDGDLNAGKER